MEDQNDKSDYAGCAKIFAGVLSVLVVVAWAVTCATSDPKVWTVVVPKDIGPPDVYKHVTKPRRMQVPTSNPEADGIGVQLWADKPNDWIFYDSQGFQIDIVGRKIIVIHEKSDGYDLMLTGTVMENTKTTETLPLWFKWAEEPIPSGN